MSYIPIGELKSLACVKRYPGNPVVKPEDVPFDCSLAFNAGVCKYQGKYVMVFRNDWFERAKLEDFQAGKKATNIGIAFSDDGINWDIKDKPIIDGSFIDSHRVGRVYDPRLTVIEGKVVMCFAVDTFHGVRGGVAVTEDFENWEVKSVSAPENRNMVLFPEKINGKYVRLERPFPMYGRGREKYESTRFDIWLSTSPDLVFWGETDLLMGMEHVDFANDKLGPAAPPIKTDKGWLTTFHSVDIDDSRGKFGWEKSWKKRYCGGIMLLDLKNPRKVIGLSQIPLLAPEAPYELKGGFRDQVIFPGGMILEDSGEVKIYYGAGDAVECLATADVNDLLAACKKVELNIKQMW